MMELIADMPSGCVGVRASGDVTADDYRQVLEPALDAATRDGGKARFLYLLDADLGDYTAGAMWQDAEVGIQHVRDFARLAVVTDSEGVRRAVHAFGFLFTFPVRFFDLDELPEAQAWLAASD